MSLEIRVIPFEPFAWVAGKRTGEREDKLAERIRQEMPLQTLTEFLEDRADRLVALRVQFFLWEGRSNVTNTRPKKDVDNLLNVVFDVLKIGPHGVGLIESDSYICDVHATKHLVAESKDEGYKISIEEYRDERMLGILKDSLKKNEL
jgi:Holliday junction resolvase RusA-like endonuclease